MHRRTLTYSLLLVVTLSFAAVTSAADKEYTRQDLIYEPQVYEFGSVGIDYSVHHDFLLINQGKKPVRILDTEIDCDCTTLRLSDSTAAPGDTIVLMTSLKTSNLYGPTGKSLTIITDHPLLDRIAFRFPAIVGQWSGGLKPLPVGLMFLPGNSAKEVRIWNRHFASVEMSVAHQYDSSFHVDLVESSANRGDMLTLMVTPRENLPAGTHTSNFTLSIERKGEQEPARLTIPVKIVRY